MKNDRIPMIQIDDTIISIDCLSEKFCCDLDACKGECCIEGDACLLYTSDAADD